MSDIPTKAVEAAYRAYCEARKGTPLAPGEYEATASRVEIAWITAALTAAAPLIAVQATTPTPCVMRHAEPYDFAWCETHDTTFPLGEKCRFDGREPWQVYAEEADEQRQRAVCAEMERDQVRARIEALRDEWRAVADRLTVLATMHSDPDTYTARITMLVSHADALDALLGGAG